MCPEFFFIDGGISRRIKEMDKRLIENLIRLFTFATTLLVLNGCAELLSAKKFNTIRLNGYTGGKPPIQTGKKIFVLKNKKATNPLFEDEIAIKIKKVLKIKGFVPIDESHFSDANYILTFSYSIDSGKEKISSSEQEGKALVQ